ncbi:MAG TPA: hypothetical protein VFX28_03905, partial [Methylomirabilota bacterium]|nr:hypothetical protein [Methylomirabilota bacterium]
MSANGLRVPAQPRVARDPAPSELERLRRERDRLDQAVERARRELELLREAAARAGPPPEREGLLVGLARL